MDRIEGCATVVIRGFQWRPGRREVRFDANFGAKR